MKRESGILLSITSLPSRYGIGCFSKEAYEFVDRLKEAGQSYWQILPLGPTSYGDSPYQSFSTFAGNPYFISLEDLIQEGVLTEEECSRADFGSRPDFVDYAKVYEERYPLLRKAYERSSISLDPEFRKFRFMSPVPRAATMAIASSVWGTARSTSIKRMIRLSTLLP